MKGRKRMKKLVGAIVAAMLIALLATTVYAETTSIGLELGEEMPDFTAPLTDGTTVTLSDLLKENDLVVVNIFTSWCQPCEKEFPAMEEVYEANKERMTIVSLSREPQDTLEIIADYKESHGLTFPMGLTEDNLSFLTLSGVPVNIFINRDGKVAYVRVGAFLQIQDFEDKVNAMLDPNYDGKVFAEDRAVSLTPYLFGGIGIFSLLQVISLWILLRKAGKPGWHSLIPLLNSYQEFDIGWNGWFGILSDLLMLGGLISGALEANLIFKYGPRILSLAVAVPGCIKIAKSFGKGTVFGVLMAIPGLRVIMRLILGLSKAKYLGKG